MTKSRIAITMGDAAGIGPEVALKALAALPAQIDTEFLLVGSFDVWHEMAQLVKFPPKLVQVSADDWGSLPPESIAVLSSSDLSMNDVVVGQPDFDTGRAASRAIEIATQLALTQQVHAVVTAPIQKEALNAAGYHFPGHTEMLQKLANADEVVMLMYSSKLATALVSTHCAISDTPRFVTREKILRVIELSWHFLQHLKIDPIRIAVAAYNPHAGEAGLFGQEEIRIIRPAVAAAVKRGIPIAGPFPPDTVFAKAVQGEYDLVVAMYHDQGLIPFKLLAFDEGVNVTLGLPFWRTSPDHGTALDLAGKNKASYKSMYEAILLAARLIGSSL